MGDDLRNNDNNNCCGGLLDGILGRRKYRNITFHNYFSVIVYKFWI